MHSADTFRAGAFDQLKQNATRIKVPFFGSYVESDPVKIAAEGVAQFRAEGYEIILVDTSGRHKQEADLFEEMQQVKDAVDPNEVIFVVDSSIGASVADQAAAFKAAVPIGSVIITKLDGHAKGGGALSAVTATGSPITFIGTGEHFDEFEKFEPTSFVSRLLGLGDMKGLLETFREKTNMMEKGPEMMERIGKGSMFFLVFSFFSNILTHVLLVFTLRDMREQFNTVLKAGSVGQLVSMIPGLSNLSNNGAIGREGTARVQKMIVIMDSMTNDELDCIFKVRKRGKDGKWTFTLEKIMNQSRMERIARGSGISCAEVDLLMQQYKQMATMVTKMGKSGLMNEPNTMQQMKRNPAQVMQQLQQSMDPRVMAKLGGTQNMMNMLKEMGGMEGMEEMMKSMGGPGGMAGAMRGGGRGGGKRR
jgi:signal recognition particle subunit SRP54